MRDITNPPAAVRAADDLRDLAAAINADHEAGEAAARRGLEHYRAAGLKLLQAKAACGHGGWLRWLKENVRFNERRAQRYIELAKCDVTSDLAAEWQRISGNAPPDDDAEEGEAPAPEPPPTPHVWQMPPPSAADPGDEDDDGGDGRPDDAPVAVAGLGGGGDDGETYYLTGDGRVLDVEDDGVDVGEDGWPCDTDTGERLVPRSAGQVREEMLRRELPPAAAALPMARPARRDYVTLDDWAAMGEAERAEALAGGGGDRRFNAQGSNENIEWALWSWNPVTGCLHNCPYCYARDIANRFYEQKFAPALIPDRLPAPQNTPFPAAKAAGWMGHKNVFTCSMADLFGRWVPREWIDAVLAQVRAAPQWNFLFLTKFPQRMAEFDFPENAWVGTTVDCQARVANAERAFRKVKAGVKWLSCEPLIEPLRFKDLGAFDWVVLGGSSRSTQTPEWHPPRQWINAIYDEATRAGVRVYEKANLLRRIQQYPGVEPDEPQKAPDALRYLPEVG